MKYKMLTLTVCTFLLLVAATGCRESTGTFPVKGKIILDGAVLDEARITFVPIGGDGMSASGISDAEGNYTIQTSAGLPGTKPGEYKVIVKKIKSEWDGKSYLPSHTLGDQQEVKIKKVKNTQILPKIYTINDMTPLKATVTEHASKNVFDFELKMKP